VLVATDVAARGVHVEGIAHVVNYDLPQVPGISFTVLDAPAAPDPAARHPLSARAASAAKFARSRSCWISS
jgi:hypothetical protein